jgi:Family of unknown function (DUF6402)
MNKIQALGIPKIKALGLGSSRDIVNLQQKNITIKYISSTIDEKVINLSFVVTQTNLTKFNAKVFVQEMNAENEVAVNKIVSLKNVKEQQITVSFNKDKQFDRYIWQDGFLFQATITCDGVSGETLEFVITTKNKISEDDSITVEGVKYDYNEIKRRVDLINKKFSSIISKLTEEEKTILNLPLLEWNYGFRYGAVMSIHWLEASKKSIKLDYSFFVSGNRLKNIDIINLKSYFEHLEYLCEQNFGYSPSNPDGVWLFLFNDSIPAIKKSRDLFLKQINILEKSTRFGDYEDLSNVIEKPKVKNNLFQSFDIGSYTGDLDDVGAALGRFSLRCYFKGILNKNDQSNGIKWFLNIEEIGVRFVDEFSFNDPRKEFLSPSSWTSQNLGFWKNDINNPDVTRNIVASIIDEKYVKITNEDFIKLKEKAKKNGITIGGDFLIYSDLKKISDEFIKKPILIY